MDISALQKARYGYKPKLPASLSCPVTDIITETGAATEAKTDTTVLKGIFKQTYGKPLVTFTKKSSGKNEKLCRELKVGVILSGGQAPGGHNVIAGLYDGLKNGNAKSVLYGLLDGPIGLINNKAEILTGEKIDQYRNTGGFDIIGSGRTKIETPQQFASSLETAKKLGLNAVVIIGGDDSNTNAALLAEYFLANGSDIQVIGCPKTIDGDLKNEYIETSFGFDTACKTYSELIGNLMRDANSSKKYWHFVKLMGRAASHIALECAMQTQPNICLISEEIEKHHMSLEAVVNSICSSVVKRAENGHNYGIVLIPEGLVEFIPEIKSLINELNDTIAHNEAEFSKLDVYAEQLAWLYKHISAASYNVLHSLPHEIGREFLMDRDPHGNVQVSLIETEKLLIGMVKKKLHELKAAGTYKGKFAALAHFFGYEGRCAFPSNFDSDYCYSLGYSAFVLIAAGFTGYLSSVRNLTAKASEWIAGGVPITMMMNIEQRHGEGKPVIKKALVELDGKPFRAFKAIRDEWAVSTSFIVPGSIQYFGPPEVCDEPTITLKLEKN
ncbi:MAG: diphosphate--fructose-6-phosphate 1-phosphotransferase [Treponema sp.]|jgi:pyrophosphate--fructose-6-phosphate 1-phosphotransferase|nr:diphosphate--fructose-6-phosphate 1-phosphotransferase [Treponema sp.]